MLRDIKKRLILGREAVTNLDKIMNDISMTTKIRIVNAMVFSSNKL